MARRGAAALTLCAAVMGILAALIAVGKGQSEQLLTILMFVGVAAPATYALWAMLHDMLKLRRGPLVGVMAAVAAAAVTLVVITSPGVLQSVFSPRQIERERDDAQRLAGKPWYPAKSFECDTASRCYIPNVKAPAFNAFRNSSVGGDERRFAAATQKATLFTIGSATSALPVSVLEVEPGDEVRVTAYYRNGGCRLLKNPKTKAFFCDPKLVTRDARVGVFVPSTESAGLTVLVVLYAENARPQRIADRVAFVSHTPFRLEFIPESARILNGYSGGKTIDNRTAPGTGIRLDDRVVADVAQVRDDPTRFTPQMGVQLGYNKLDGALAPGFGQYGYVSLRMRVI
jgi:hypothetical protein